MPSKKASKRKQQAADQPANGSDAAGISSDPASSSPAVGYAPEVARKRPNTDNDQVMRTAEDAHDGGNDDQGGMGEFEDPFDDELDDDDDGFEDIVEDDEDEEDDAAMDVDDSAKAARQLERQRQQEEEEDEDNVQVFLPGQALGEGEVLVHDSSAYEMLHQIQVEWPCLSFDVLRDNLGLGRKSFPMTTYLVAGSQAEHAKDNKVYVMKLSELHRTKDADDDEDDDEDDLDEDPVLEYRSIPHNGGVNRIRVMPHPEHHVAATWSDVGKVYIWDLTQHAAAIDTPGLIPQRDLKPVHVVDRHGRNEGFAMDWSTINGNGRLLTGDVARQIYLTTQSQSRFETSPKPFLGHESSVEDIQWAPQEETVFASCSADKTVRIWDIRDPKKAQISYVAHDSDVNVISWNRLSDKLIASGSDSGAFSIWDLRNVHAAHISKTNSTPAATFSWHKEQITSLEWHPFESSVIAVAGADDQITLWDLALERDPEEEGVMGNAGGQVEVPPQLLFVHQGQEDIKEVHWLGQLQGVLGSTAGSGFNVFKTINS